MKAFSPSVRSFQHHNATSMMGHKFQPRNINSLQKSHSVIQTRLFTTKDVKNDPSDRITQFAMLVEKDLSTSPNLRDILNGVWKNEVVTSQCPDLIIRLTSLRGQVSKRIWERRGNNPDDIQILAVGTVAIPHHLKSYHSFLQNFWNNTEKFANEARRLKGNDYEVGYDLLSKGSDQARDVVLRLWNEHYGFPEQTLKSCIANSAIISGGMRGLKDIADGLILRAKSDGSPHRFIQPDNSFGTWWNIIERPEKNDSFRRQIFTVAARPENKLHLTAEDVDNHYKTNAPVPFESWYITPVGNPSGTAMTKEQLRSTCQRILHYNPKAVIVLDVVYVRTMTRQDAKGLMEGVVSDSNILDRVVFLESFSKSHGLCRERIGMYFSTNEKLFTTIHASNIAFSAGPGHHKDYQFLALGNSSPEDKKATDDLHHFWQRERKGLYNFLMSNKNKHLFDEKQVHIRTEDLDKPCTLYILMKTREGVKAQDIFMSTGILGVDTPMLSGHYVRFSLGTLLNPAFSKYL